MLTEAPKFGKVTKVPEVVSTGVNLMRTSNEWLVDRFTSPDV